MNNKIPEKVENIQIGYRYLAQGTDDTGWALFYQNPNPFVGLELVDTGFRRLREVQDRVIKETRRHLN